MPTYDYVDLDPNDLDPAVQYELEENEAEILRLNAIPKNQITPEELDELRYRVWNRPNILRRLKKK